MEIRSNELSEKEKVLLIQSVASLEEAINQMKSSYNRDQLQKVLDDFNCTINNLD